MPEEKKFKLTVYISNENATKIGYKATDDRKTKSEVVDEILTLYFSS